MPRHFAQHLASLACATVALLTASEAPAESWLFVTQGTPLSYFPGHQTPTSDWTATAFSESSAWTPSTPGFGIGYGDGDDNTVLSTMSGSYLTVYVRSHFTVGGELPKIQHVTLETTFDDGFVAYLNGTEIGRASVPSGALQADTAASSHEVTDGAVTFTVSPSLLVQGDNVLAVEVHNTSLSSSDLSFIPSLWADDGTIPPNVNITRGPFLQQVGRRSALVVWETDAPAPSDVKYGPTTAMPWAVTDDTQATHHVAVLDNLDPATEYFFQVQSAKIPSERGQFRTEVDRASPFRLAVFGDTRSNHNDHRDVINTMVLDGPLAYFHGGDLVEDGADDGLWDTFFDVEAPMMLRAPLYPAIGNHEGDGPQYVDIFELPANSPSPERYFTVRYANALFISVDLFTNPFGTSSDQYAWLETVLADAAADPDLRQRFVQLHHGPYDSGSHGSNTSVRSTLSPLFEQYGVDVVFSGHDHCYERSTVNGVKYVVTGGGGAPLYAVSGDTWTEVRESVLHYCLLDFNGPRAQFTAKRLDGSVLDGFVLGEGVSECTAPTSCDGRPHGACESDETGSWACVEGGCIWNCHKEPTTYPDGGVDGSGPDGAGGASGAAGSGGGTSGTGGGTSGTGGGTSGTGGGTSGTGGGTVDPDAGTGGSSASAGAGNSGGSGTGGPARTAYTPTNDEGSSCACAQVGRSPSNPSWPVAPWAALMLAATASVARRRR